MSKILYKYCFEEYDEIIKYIKNNINKHIIGIINGSCICKR